MRNTIRLLVALGLSCGGEESPRPTPWLRFRPCTLDGDCLGMAGADERGSWPPLCLGGLCQLTTTHRCDVDTDCDDVAPPGLDGRCGTMFQDVGRLCDVVMPVGGWCVGQEDHCLETGCSERALCGPTASDICWEYGCYIARDGAYGLALCLPTEGRAYVPWQPCIQR